MTEAINGTNLNVPKFEYCRVCNISTRTASLYKDTNSGYLYCILHVGLAGIVYHNDRMAQFVQEQHNASSLFNLILEAYKETNDNLKRIVALLESQNKPSGLILPE